jgi:NitT/TauT family transport system substrate-binding protein
MTFQSSFQPTFQPKECDPMVLPRFAVLGLSGLAICAVTQMSFAEDTTWRHGTVAPKGDAGLIYSASANGFDKKNGITIAITSLKGDAVLTKALLAGELDSYEGNPGGPMIAEARGGDLRVLGCNWPGLPYAIYTKPNVNSLADLKGHAIAVSDPGSLPDLFSRAAIRSAGLDPNKDVQYVRAGSDSDRIKAVIAGVVAAAPSSSEFRFTAQKYGLKMLVQAKDVTPKFMRSCIITTQKVIDTKHAAAVAFVAAEMEGLTYALAHEDQTIALSNKITGAAPGDNDAKTIFDEAVAGKLLDPQLGLDKSKFFYLRDLLADSGQLPKNFDPSVMLNTSIRDEALKRVQAAK